MMVLTGLSRKGVDCHLREDTQKAQRPKAPFSTFDYLLIENLSDSGRFPSRYNVHVFCEMMLHELNLVFQ